MVLLGAAFAQSTLQQRITISLEELSVEDALYQLTDQAGIKISFSNIILPDRLVSLNYQQATLEEVLNDLLAGSSIRYQEIGGQVALLPRVIEQEKHTISGFLKDANSGEHLINANIIDLSSKQGTTTNAYGFYSLSLPQGNAKLAYSYTGYNTQYREVKIKESVELDLGLEPSLTLQPIEIVSHRFVVPVSEYQAASGQVVDMKQVERLPALGGEADIMRVVQLQPGVQTGTDGIGGLHIRGGTNGQNLVMIDGVPVYNVSHAAGLFSIFNTNAIRSATLHKGGFPARYGGRLSSVMDIRTKEGNRKQLKMRGDIGTLAGRITMDGPIISDKSSFFISGRMSLIDWYLEPLTENLKSDKGESNRIDYKFYDLNAKLNYEFSRKDKLYLSFYTGADAYSNQGSSSDTLATIDDSVEEPALLRADKGYYENVGWGNTVGALRWNHLVTDRLFANVSATYSGLDMDITYENADSLVTLSTDNTEQLVMNYGQYESQIRDVALRLDFDFVPANNHYLRFGINATHHHFTPGVLSYYHRKKQKDKPVIDQPEVEVSRDKSISAMAFAAYIEDEFRLGSRFYANIGLHSALFRVGQKNYTSIQPRALARYQAGENWQLEATYSRMTHHIHLLSNSLLGLPTELWVPSTENIRPQTGWQVSLASRWSFTQSWRLGAEVYYKGMDDLLTYAEGAQFLNDWESNVTSGTGRSYGLELLLEKRTGKLTGWAGYGLLWADRHFDLINRGNRYPYRYDRRHEFKTGLTYRIQDWFELSASWVLSSGFAFSLPANEYTVSLPDGGEFTALDYGEKNQYRMPYYHRLDFSTNFYLDLDHIQHTIRVGVYNLYNRHNPLYYHFQTSFASSGRNWVEQKELTDAWLIPLLPSLSYSIEF